jgi:nucleoside-triphosphatase THEP1
MRDRGRRVGFSITTLDGRRGILAHIDIRSRKREGRYGVNLQDIATEKFEYGILCNYRVKIPAGPRSE